MTRVHLSKVLQGGVLALVVYDVERAELVHDVSDYLLATSGNWSALTLEQESRHLAQFWEYLRQQEMPVAKINDGVLKAFREEQTRLASASRISRGKLEDAQETVNVKLRRIYHWLHWLQANRRLPEGHVARHGEVISEPTENSTKRWTASTSWHPKATFTCPLVVPVKGGKSKHRLNKQVPSEQTVDDLHALFLAKSESDYVASRNCLFTDIVNRIALRRGAANSLDVTQFSEKEILAARDELLIVPKKQKNGYSFSFPVPLDLAWEIHRHIRGPRQDFIESKGIGRSLHQDRLFLAAHTGRPMTDRALTQILSKAMRQLGFQKGAGPHLFRSKFAGETSDKRLKQRKELGLATDARSIAVETSLLMGQARPESMYPYAVASLSKASRMNREDDKATIARLRAEVAKLKAALAATGSPSAPTSKE